MKSLKNILRKPIFVCALIGGLGLSTGILAFKNIGLKNQNNYFSNRNSEIRDLYLNSVAKYTQLRADSIETLNKHFSERISLRRENLELANKMDSAYEAYIVTTNSLKNNYLELDSARDILQSIHINFAEISLDKLKEKSDLFETIINLTQERDFYKEYVHYLDSALFKCQNNKILEGQK